MIYDFRTMDMAPESDRSDMMYTGSGMTYRNTEKSEQQELIEDLVQIITVFSCKLQGKRANKAKKLIRELRQEEADGKRCV